MAELVPGTNKNRNLTKLFTAWLRLYLWDGNTFPVAFAQEYWYLAVVIPQE